MASKLEKAQNKYEDLLRQLGEKAEMVGALDRASPRAWKKYKRVVEAIEDRKLELEFLDSELEEMEKDKGRSQEAQESEVDSLRNEVEKKEKILEVKKNKIAPLKSKLAGAEYDLKFTLKGLAEEERKVKVNKEKEDFKKAKAHETTVKKMKIDVLKRKKAIQEMKRDIRDIEKPIKQLNKEIEEIDQTLAGMEEGADGEADLTADEMAEELNRQRKTKASELKRAEMAQVNILADLGEDLYERRFSHPVLNKYYADLDAVAQTIDSLQK